MKKLIIIPAYNEEESIEGTIQDIEQFAQDYDYLIVNDSSTDKTGQLCKEKGFRCITLPVNLGIGGAVQTGYLYAMENGYDVAVQVDADGQHDVRFLHDLFERMEETQAGMVIGSRFIEKKGFQSSALRRTGITFLTWLIRIVTGHRITDPTSGFRMVNRDVICLFARDYPRDYPEPESVVCLLRNKLKVEEVPVQMRERQGGTSSIHMWRSVYYMIKVSIAIIIEWIRG